MSLYNFLGSYNKAYKTKRIDKKDFTAFIESLKDFYSKTGNIENINEDLLKDKFKECVLKKYEAYVNENRADISIKKNNKLQVICEFKSPKYKNDMLSIDSGDINKKALHEAIWYFYNQESEEISYQIKHILITDTENFFFFDTNDFWNKHLKKICLDFKNKQLAISTTKQLYPLIEQQISDKNLKFKYSSFDLKTVLQESP